MGQVLPRSQHSLEPDMQGVSSGLEKHVDNATGRLHELGFRAVFKKQHCVRALLGKLDLQPELAKFCPTL